MSNTVKGWLCAIAGMVTMGVSHLCYSIIIILMASMVAAVGCSAAEGALIFSITAIGSLVASLFIGSLLKVLKTKYVYVIGGILQGALLVTMGYSTNLMLVYVMAFLFGISTLNTDFEIGANILTPTLPIGKSFSIYHESNSGNLSNASVSPVGAQSTIILSYLSLL